MPFIDAKITKQLSEEEKTRVKARFGKAISIMHKSETYLMVGIEDNFDLYFAGKRLESGAFVSVSTFGHPMECNKMTAEICKILQEEANIPPACVYVKYQGTDEWGWNGSNF